MAGAVRQTDIADCTDGALKALQFEAPARRPLMEHWVRRVGRNSIRDDAGGCLGHCAHARFLADAIDHRAQTVGALRGKVLDKTDL